MRTIVPPTEDYARRGETNHIEAIAQQIDYRRPGDWHLRVGTIGKENYVQALFYAPDLTRDDGEAILQEGGRVLLSPYAPTSSIVRAIFGAIRNAELHETMEAFRHKGVRLYNPHYDVDALVLANQESDLEAPPPSC